MVVCWLTGIPLFYSLWLVECTMAYRHPRGKRIHNGDLRMRRRYLMKDDNDVKSTMRPSVTVSPSTTPSAQYHPPPSVHPLALIAADSISNPSNSFLVQLQDFTVLMEEAHSANLTIFFDKVITGELVNEFDSLISAEIYETENKAYEEGFSEIFYFSGIARFGLPVSIKDVFYAQARVLQDLKSLKDVLPNVISITVIPNKPSPDGNAEESVDRTISPALVSAVMAFVACIVGITILLGYRHYKSYRVMLEKSNNQSVSKTTVSNPELSIPREIHHFDIMSRSALSCSQIEGDEYSLADFNTLYSEAESEFDQVQGDYQSRVQEEGTSHNGGLSSNEIKNDLYTDVLQCREKKTISSSLLPTITVNESHHYATDQLNSRVRRNPGIESEDDDDDVYTTSNNGKDRLDIEKSSANFSDDCDNIVYFGKPTSSNHVFCGQKFEDNICRRENGSLVGITPLSLSSANQVIDVDPLEIENQRNFHKPFSAPPISTTLDKSPRPKDSLNKSLSLLKHGIALKLAQYKR
jgi:hypothetical protein